MTETRQTYDRDQVRERTDLVALIGQTVTLRKRGGRYLGLCPFHSEKTPSFNVDPQKGFWHCFGCGKGGDAFDFLMLLEHLSFPEALERLAERAGVPPIAVTPQQQIRKEERDYLYEANAAAALAFSKALAGKAGAAARAYLERRGMTPEMAARFGLGYAPPGWDMLTAHLKGRGFSEEVLIKAGLSLPRQRGDGAIDRFRNRVMIPIHDRRGRVVAFGGRAMSPDDQPKYLNTAETPVFRKSSTLYALHWASKTMGERGRAIVTEGYFDVIACHLAGFTEAVATLGTALGEEHVQLLRRLADRVYLVYDADSAGVNAALRGQAIFRAAEVDVRIVRLPGEHDPDSLIRAAGPEAFERGLAEALPPVAFELERLLAQHPERDTEGRLRLFRAAAKILQPLPALERAEYAEWLIEHWGGGARGDLTQLQQAVMSEVAALDRRARRRGGGADDAPAPAPLTNLRGFHLELEAITAMVQHPSFAGDVLLSLPAEAFTHAEYRAVYDALNRLAEAGAVPDARQLRGDDALTALIAGLAVRERDPSITTFEPLLDRLRDEHEKRQIQPIALALDDPAAAEALRKRKLQESERQKRRAGLAPEDGGGRSL
ncbi:MAG TPA: DNA primase, partial [Armatimonadota bacterium]|nr:DNA primase [Armatimonadota bacterium]